MKKCLSALRPSALPLLLLLLGAPWASAQAVKAAPANSARQDPAALRALVEQHLRVQSAGLPGQVAIEVGRLDPRLSLAACPDPQAFQQSGARAWGKTSVGVRCLAPAWSLYVQAKVSVTGDYVAAAVPLAQGQPIDPSQLVLLKGDLAAMPNGIVTDIAQAAGRSPTVSLPAGAPLRLDGLRSPPVVQQGQLVRVVSAGPGFKVSGEARALGNAADGQVVQARTPAGVILSGLARAGGVVEVAY
ncbi:MAG: flagellar basal body P-ring formation chaperone FlgA [Pseudomonadota bacterium]